MFKISVSVLGKKQTTREISNLHEVEDNFSQ